MCDYKSSGFVYKAGKMVCDKPIYGIDTIFFVILIKLQNNWPEGNNNYICIYFIHLFDNQTLREIGKPHDSLSQMRRMHIIISCDDFGAWWAPRLNVNHWWIHVSLNPKNKIKWNMNPNKQFPYQKMHLKSYVQSGIHFVFVSTNFSQVRRISDDDSVML